MIFLLYYAKDLMKCFKFNWKNTLVDCIDNMKIGINLMIANIASMLIIGGSRILVDFFWGIEIFGKFSFSISLTNFFLQFISQVSIVLFPFLRKCQEKKQKEVYTAFNILLSIFLPLVYVFYPFVANFLDMWLPQYQESLHYLILLLPICIFDSKMSLLYSTYFKVYRLEKQLLYVNLITMIISSSLCLLSIVCTKNIVLMLISMVFSIFFRSLLASIIIGKRMEQFFLKELIFEILISLIFIYLVWNFNNMFSYILVVFSYIIYLFVNKNNIKMLFNLKGILT